MIAKLGFVGCGNMARAIIQGLGQDGAAIGASDPSGSFPQGVQGFSSNRELVQWADFVVLAVKPQMMGEVLREIGSWAGDKPVVSIAAGVPAQVIAQALPGARVCRVMPNTPALVGQGMSVLALPCALRQEEMAFLRDVLGKIGRVVELPEAQMAAATALSGCGPAYFFLWIEAMADEGVRLGLARATAYELAAQTALGAGAMVLGSGKNPAALKDEVCSPGGATIAAIGALEHAGARAAMMDAVSAAYNRARELEA